MCISLANLDPARVWFSDYAFSSPLRLNLQRDDEEDLEAIKLGVMGGYKRKAGAYDDESEALLAAAARRAAARYRRGACGSTQG